MAKYLFWIAVALLVLVGTAALLLGGPQSRVDPALLAAFAEPGLVPAARFLTHLGDGVAVLSAAVVAAAVLLAQGHRRRAILLLVILSSQRLMVEAMKAGFDRARPDVEGRQVAVHSMAFPSGHSANVMAIGLALALLATGPQWRRPAVAAALVVAIVVGVCRMVLQVHWPSDV
ncbi:MAG TPA: phosphatase PAP2 family protein, partial [Allosphingosinicella sp.]|nr:phosphatase PAP2 family protein [Allosphingosinicella sp.]